MAVTNRAPAAFPDTAPMCSCPDAGLGVAPADGTGTPDVHDWFKAARAAGTTGSKVLAARSGGFLMLFLPEWAHLTVRARLPRLRPIDTGLEPLGSRSSFLMMSIDMTDYAGASPAYFQQLSHVLA